MKTKFKEHGPEHQHHHHYQKLTTIVVKSLKQNQNESKNVESSTVNALKFHLLFGSAGRPSLKVENK